MELNGATAIVTGSSRGIGKATAIALAKKGVAIAATARTRSDQEGSAGSLEATVREIQDRGGRAEGIFCDVSREKDVELLVQETLKKFGKIDILVNNAAVYPNLGANLLDLPLESWDLIFNVNLRGAFLCVQKTLPHMIKNKQGNIINVSSILAIRAAKGRTAYGASKAGLDRLTYGLAEEVKEYNIAVNVLSPIDLTDTPGARIQLPHADFDEWVKAEDVAQAAVWLAEQEAGTFTGRAFAVPARGQFNVIMYGRMSDERMRFTIK